LLSRLLWLLLEADATSMPYKRHIPACTAVV
jgi:hypothetical protein